MINKDDCWLWTGTVSSSGHGMIGAEMAYRVLYENEVGEIPDDLELDHLCENPVCINPEHLEPVTHRENTLRHYRRRTHCRNGHSYAEHGRIRIKRGNISKANPIGESRTCMICHSPKLAKGVEGSNK